MNDNLSLAQAYDLFLSMLMIAAIFTTLYIGITGRQQRAKKK